MAFSNDDRGSNSGPGGGNRQAPRRNEGRVPPHNLNAEESLLGALLLSRDVVGNVAELGLLVDAVSEVIKIAPAQIEPPPDFGTTVRRDFIRGMGKVAQRFVIILEPDRALDPPSAKRLPDMQDLSSETYRRIT
eukprot:gene22784-43147_t